LSIRLHPAGGRLCDHAGGLERKAIEFGTRFMQVHVDVLGPFSQGEREIRQLA
jgi:hypothetical protein